MEKWYFVATKENWFAFGFDTDTRVAIRLYLLSSSCPASMELPKLVSTPTQKDRRIPVSIDDKRAFAINFTHYDLEGLKQLEKETGSEEVCLIELPTELAHKLLTLYEL